jgi:hypothetical protein
MTKTHDELQAAIWDDERRMPPGTREVALAVAWVLHREPENREHVWRRVKAMCGPYEYTGGWRLHELVAKDAPRYEPGRYSCTGGGCEGPRLRPYKPRRPAYLDECLVSSHHPHLGDCRYTVVHGGLGGLPEHDDRVCGAYGTIQVTEKDMVTGWDTEHWFCSRHIERAREVKAQLAAMGAPPEPIPNRGGLLPRYFAGDWAKVYAEHCEIMLRHWAVPYYGVDADDWPVPGKTLIPKRPRLALVSA